MKLDLEHNSEQIKREAEQVLRSNEIYKPSIAFFDNDDDLLGRIIIRAVEGPEDKRAAFTEAMLLVPYLRADKIMLSFDDFVSTKDGITAEQDPNREEAIVVIKSEHTHALGIIMPYIRDDHGNFLDWGQKRDDVNPTAIDGDLVGTLSGMMSKEHFDPPYAKVMLRTLAARGHEISTMQDGELVAV